jgi:alpha-N-arabinofuranosidase
VWSGTGGVWPEGPHLYKVDGTYYLLISEGGTSYGHMITVARSKDPMGPFEAFAKNPLLTHRDLPAHPIQATGHGDLIQTAEGDWWMVLLGIRPSTPGHHHIGRETFLSPVSWDGGWPVINGGKPLELEMSGRGLPPRGAPPLLQTRDEFDGQSFSIAWRHVRNPASENYSLSARPGYLRLTGTEISLSDVGSPTLLVRPQTHLRMAVSTEVDTAPNLESRAGLVIRGNEDNHYELVVEGSNGGGRVVVLRTRIGGKTEEVKRVPVAPGKVRLFVKGEKDTYGFSFGPPGAEPVAMGTAPTTPFAYEKSGSFTGAFVGLYAHTKNSRVPFVADFSSFEMRPDE